MKSFTLSKAIGLAIALSFVPATAPNHAQLLQVNVDRWLNVRSATGKVFYRNGTISRPIRVGTKLQAVGDTLRTEARSSSLLDVDTGIGFIKVAENTTLQVKQLQRVSDGGHITRLEVSRGQARLQLRPFTHRSSRLEVMTPAGVSAVRGTEFGVTAQPSGKTGVATLSGSVVTAAQGQSVVVNAGSQNLIIPGEAPQPATPLKNDSSLRRERLSPISDRQVMFSGETDAVNLLFVNDRPQNIDRNGRFEVIAQITNGQVTATIVTPLGKQQDYRFTRPR
ncbi:MAG: FecR family protein [Leptolyngbyaceae cyanobacterium bins.302]|nr:FecR family protein [Leptolyngbyaceae cyanobacterium bins.302]